ncbi:MAG: DNA repair protein RecN (Recombination protein N) [Dasania sp.]|jgi:DNA repair protein RecN (Recombination protein N)
MLETLSVENFLVFPNLHIDFTKGLNIITGETGAGKSTILASLNFLFGGRSDASFVRTGCDKSTLELTFKHHSSDINALLDTYDITPDSQIIIRRIVHKTKPAKCYVNGVLVTAGFLANLADYYVQMIGQFEDHRFLNPAGFRKMLDSLIIDSDIKQAVSNSFHKMDSIKKQIESEKIALQNALREKDYLNHVVAELSSLNPQIGEEDQLIATRTTMMNIEKNAVQLQSIEQSLTYDGGGIESILLQSIKNLSGLESSFDTDLPPITTSLNQALEHISGAVQALSRFNATLEFDPNLLNDTEERLFALRAAARKHHVSVDNLAHLYSEFQTKLEKIDNSEANFDALEKAYQNTLDDYTQKANILRQNRLTHIPFLEKKITAGLHDLNMKHAQFRITLVPASPSQYGSDKVLFELATSQGMAFGELHKTASGGELSRFMLSAKSAIIDNYSCLIFDEIDRGVGGATAEAVGLKLRDLSQKIGQLIVITHSPQVAAKGDTHFHIEKQVHNNQTFSVIQSLTGQSRHNEIARMLSGATITDEALAAAKNLIQDHLA